MWRDRALDAWRALEADALTQRRGRPRVLAGPDGADAPLWPLIHVLWAAADLRAAGADVPVEPLAEVLERHRSGEAYRATPRERARYFDDNAWLGLASLRLADTTDDPTWRERAVLLATFATEGEHPDGGVRWREGAESRNTCSTASSAWLRARAFGSDDGPADRWIGWLERTLRGPDGLFADRIEGVDVDRYAWSYNQGAVVAAREAINRPDDGLVEATIEHWDGERRWREPPPFLAIAARALLDAPRTYEAAVAWLDPYLELLLDRARDPMSGWFTRGGIGTYDGTRTIDQAAVVQLFALRSLA
jgi:hypothetical protein